MDFYTSNEILSSVLYAIAFGLAMGVADVSASVVINYFESIIRLPLQIFKAALDIKKIGPLFLGKNELYRSDGKIKSFAKDFIYILAYGILFSVLVYITTDGDFRFYVLVISLVFSYISRKTLGAFIEKIVVFLLKGILGALAAFFALVLFLPISVARRIYSIFIHPIAVKMGGAFKKKAAPILANLGSTAKIRARFAGRKKRKQ